MGKSDRELFWARIAALFGTLGGWLLLMKVMHGFLRIGRILIPNYQSLVMLSFSLALLGLIAGTEIHSREPLRIKGATGLTTVFTICTFSSALIILFCLALIIIDPDLWIAYVYQG